MSRYHFARGRAEFGQLRQDVCRETVSLRLAHLRINGDNNLLQFSSLSSQAAEDMFFLTITGIVPTILYINKDLTLVRHWLVVLSHDLTFSEFVHGISRVY